MSLEDLGCLVTITIAKCLSAGGAGRVLRCHRDPDTEEEEERHGGGDTGDLSDFRCAVVSSTLSVLMRSVAFIISCLCQIPLFRLIELTFLLLSSLISMISNGIFHTSEC